MIRNKRKRRARGRSIVDLSRTPSHPHSASAQRQPDKDSGRTGRKQLVLRSRSPFAPLCELELVGGVPPCVGVLALARHASPSPRLISQFRVIRLSLDRSKGIITPRRRERAQSKAKHSCARHAHMTVPQTTTRTNSNKNQDYVRHRRFLAATPSVVRARLLTSSPATCRAEENAIMRERPRIRRAGKTPARLPPPKRQRPSF